VRYGAALALGIACAGTGLPEVVDMLESMTKDLVDYVRQSAFISLGLVLIQHTEKTNAKVTTVREKFATVIGDKHESMLSKVGATMGQGIIDAGGRNVSILLQSRSGQLNTSAIVGLAAFSQFWYWYPLTHFLSMAFTPTAVIGVNKDLKIPKFSLLSNAPPSWFAYPANIKPPTEKEIEKVAAAVLSTTARAKARARKERKASLLNNVSTICNLTYRARTSPWRRVWCPSRLSRKRRWTLLPSLWKKKKNLKRTLVRLTT
jgi:26S proteasome regulatory subunit N2